MNRTPLILAIVLLLLPVLYVGSYLALVIPGGRLVVPDPSVRQTAQPIYVSRYRADGRWLARFFWPLAQIDQRIRPDSWRSYPYWHQE